MKFLQCQNCENIILEERDLDLLEILKGQKSALSLTEITKKFYGKKESAHREKTKLITIGRVMNKLESLRLVKTVRYGNKRLIVIGDLSLFEKMKVVEL